MTSENDVAWAAGLFEGEGCVYFDRPRGPRKPNGSWRMTLQMTDRDVVERFKAVVGCGSVHQAKPRRDHYKPVWRWDCAARHDVQRVLRLLLPYFGERRAAKAKECLSALADLTT